MNEDEQDSVEQQPTDNLASDVILFSSNLPYWAKFLSERILRTGSTTSEDLASSYIYLLEELGISPVGERKPIDPQFPTNSSGNYLADLVFTRLSDVEGVNALAENQTIEFNPHLTIVYGVNGSGKSGYVRLMKKVFYSKSPEEILGNIHVNAEQKDVTASFHFSSNSSDYPLKCPEDEGRTEFRQFSVFDGASVLKHLEQKNEFQFRPAGLSFFAKLTESIQEIERLLNEDIAKKKQGPTLDDLAAIYEGESDIKTLVLGLSGRTNLADIRKVLPYTAEEKEERARIEKEYDELLIASKGAEKEIQSLLEIKSQILARRKMLASLNVFTTAEAIANKDSLIDALVSKEALASTEGIEKFRTTKLKEVGSSEWKAFITAAEKFAAKQSQEYADYPRTGDNCLFCQQPLPDYSIELVQNYWVFIKSVAEADAAKAKSDVDSLKELLVNADYELFPKENTLTVWLFNKKPSVLSDLTQYLSIHKELVQLIILSLDQRSKRPLKAYQIGDTELKQAEDFATTAIELLRSGSQAKEFERMRARITYLAHKEKIETHFSKSEDYVARQAWIAKSSKANFLKRKVTDAEKSLSERYFNRAYIDLFNKECLELNGSFGIDVSHSGSAGKSSRQLRLKGRSPNSILSEGEQKVIAIADFLSESKMSEINRGIIFDDPVNSLDERRKGEIANRLVKEADERQVIVFTHDLVFMSSLLTHNDPQSGKISCHWVESVENRSGQVWLNNTPSFEREYRSAEPAKKHYQEAAKPNCPPASRESFVKLGFTALRTCYEVLVIHELFCDVVRRFNERVSVEALSDVNFDQELVEELQDSFYQCCRYMEGHSHSDKYAYKRPEPKDLNAEILRYEGIKSKIKKAKKSE